MRKFSVFLCIITLSIALFGGFSTIKTSGVVSAQTRENLNKSTYTHEIAQQQVLNLFDSYQNNAINFLIEQTKGFTSQQGMAEAKALEELKPKLTALILQSKNIYLENYDKSLPPWTAQINAISKLQAFFGPGFANLRVTSKAAGLLAVTETFKGNIRTELEIAKAVERGEGSGNLTSSTTSVENAAKTVAAIKEKSDKGKCTFWNWTISDCISEGVTWIIKVVFLQIAGYLVWLTANMFNYAMQFGVLEFAKWAPNTLYPIWMIVRQTISLVLLFIGIYVGILYITGDNRGNFERYLPWFVIFALFVNFSYPLTRTAIDISNIVTLKMYAATMGEQALSASITSKDTAGFLILQRLGLDNLITSATADSASKAGTNLYNSIDSIPGALIAVVFVFYTAYVFFMVTALLVMRTVALVFITIASPILLIDSVIPLLGDKAKTVRGLFVSQLFVAPVFVILLSITLSFMQVFSTLNTSLTGAAKGSGESSIVTFFNILIMLVMLTITVKVTKSTAGSLGEQATEWMGKVGGFATGGVGALGRQTLGRAAAKLRDSKWVERNQNSFIGRRAYDLSNSVAKSSFDLRNSSVVAKGAGMLGSQGGLFKGGMGQGAKTNFDDTSKKRQEKIDARLTRIQTRHERDEYEKDDKGKIVYDANGLPKMKHRKGDVDQAGVEARDRYVENKGSLFGLSGLTAKQKEEMDQKLIDQKEKERMEEYGKLKTKEQKAAYIANLSQELEKIKKTKGEENLTSVDARTVVSVLQKLTKQEKDKLDSGAAYREAYNEYKNLEDLGDGGRKMREFFGNQPKEVQDYILAKDHGEALKDNEKITKQNEDKAYREATLQNQRDAVQAQRESTEVQRKLTEALNNKQNEEAGGTTPSDKDTRRDNPNFDTSGMTLETERAAEARVSGKKEEEPVGKPVSFASTSSGGYGATTVTFTPPQTFASRMQKRGGQGSPSTVTTTTPPKNNPNTEAEPVEEEVV